MSGSVTAIVGSMFSGKSTELIRQLRRAQIGGKSTTLFKPKIDNRYSEDEVVSHDGVTMSAIVVPTYKEILEVLPYSSDVVGLDEIQFFDPEIWRVIDKMAALGKKVYAAGLSTDFMGAPFETTARVSMIADTVVQFTAVCMGCGNDAVWTQMVVDGEEITDGDRVQVGGSESYEPRCRNCFVRGNTHE